MTELAGYTPFRFRELQEQTMVTNEIGDFGFFSKDIVSRFFSNDLLADESQKFRDLAILLSDEDRWRLMSLARRLVNKSRPQKKIHYLIVIPTLRCNLTCSYCQVSRAPLKAKGFDWDDVRLGQFQEFLEKLEPDHLKLEFQGGEPTLRPDLLVKIINICSNIANTVEFVICSNISEIEGEIADVIDRDDVIISTSLDGPIEAMSNNRTQDDELARKTLKNLERILERYGPSKISALPTITESQFSNPKSIIDAYVDFGFSSIFLRPVNYQGFARKKHAKMHEEMDTWNSFYISAINYIKELNQRQYFEEFYLANLTRSIFGHRKSGFVDLRSPSRFLDDYCVIDFNGKIYPSDEARMLSRIRHVDLSVGHLDGGVDRQKVEELNFSAMNQIHEDCTHCAYMPFCGIDIVDDMSRYGRMDVMKADTWFCRRHMFLFDFIFERVANRDREWLDLFLRWAQQSMQSNHAYELFT